MASVTGRIGYAWDRFLGYVKLGGAFQRSTYSLLVAGFTGATASETRFGWTAGIGGEYAFLDWLEIDPGRIPFTPKSMELASSRKTGSLAKPSW